MLAILAQPAFELGWTDGAAPVIGQCLDFEPECLGPHAPVQREIAAFDDQHLVAGREQVDQRRLPGAVSGGGIGENSLVGLKYAFQAGEAFLGNRLELRRGEVDRPAVHRPQDAVRDIGRPGILIEMVPATDRHLQSPVPFHALRLYAGRVRSASCGSVAKLSAKCERGRLWACLFALVASSLNSGGMTPWVEIDITRADPLTSREF